MADGIIIGATDTIGDYSHSLSGFWKIFDDSTAARTRVAHNSCARAVWPCYRSGGLLHRKPCIIRHNACHGSTRIGFLELLEKEFGGRGARCWLLTST